MKVVHVVLGRANPNRMNGVNNVVHNIATSLHAKDINIEVWGITSSLGRSGDDYIRAYKLKVFNKFMFRVFPSLHLLKSILKENNKSVIFHFHGSYIIEFFILAVFLKSFGYKWLVTPHGGYSKNTLSKNSFLKNVYIKICDSIYINKSEKVQALAYQEKQDILTCFKKASLNVIVIPNGVNIPQITLNEDKLVEPYFVYCGRLHKEKGLDFLLKGYLVYVSNGGKRKLYIIGDGKEASYIKKFIESNSLRDEVKMFGALFNEDKNKVLATASAFIAPSRSEGFPIALLEALSLNLPLVVTKETNFGGIVRDNNLGIELESTSPEVISRALFHIETTPNEFYGERPQKFVSEHYSWEVVTSKLCDDFYKL